MKNKYLTKYLCITMVSAMVAAGPASAYAGEGEDLFGSQGPADPGIFSDAAMPEGAPSLAPLETLEEPPKAQPSKEPTKVPTEVPESVPSKAPTKAPAEVPEDEPSKAPTETPEDEPSKAPTKAPTETPEILPSKEPTKVPTETPESVPSKEPTKVPTETPEILPSKEPTRVPTKAPEVLPSQTPGQEPVVSPTQIPGDTPAQTPTGAPGQGPEGVTPTPFEGVSYEEKVRDLIDRIEALSFGDITLESRQEIVEIRKAYDALPEIYKEQVVNYPLFQNMEQTLYHLEHPNQDLVSEEGRDNGALSDGEGVEALDGQPLYYTDMVSNLHAGKEFYLNSLKEYYQLSFSEDFSQVMEAIEAEYQEKVQAAMDKDASLRDASLEDASLQDRDLKASFLVENWQDVLAVYIYRQTLEGKESFVLDASCKEELAAVFEELNPLVCQEGSSGPRYAGYHINDYIKMHGIEKEDRAVLKKYTETDCKLLCAVVTAAKGFVRQSLGEGVSQERVNVVAAAYSLVGEVGYFWGGKSSVLGKDPAWGTVQKVTSQGSKSTGTLRAYGLDCSGFVTWSVINGYQDPAMGALVGSGTTDQWLKAGVISEAQAQPGDLVFQKGPEAGPDNHVGILCGKTDAGDWIVVHCSSSQNGVTVGEAYGAGFRYIRQPSFYGFAQQAEEEVQSKALTSSVSVCNGLEDLLTSQPGEVSGLWAQGQIVPSQVAVQNAISDLFSSGQEEAYPSLGRETLPDNIVVHNGISSLISQKPEGEALSVLDTFASAGQEEAFLSPVQVENGLQGVLGAEGSIFGDH